MNEDPYTNRELKEMFGDIKDSLVLLCVVNPMTSDTQAQPIRYFPQILSAFIRPVHLMTRALFPAMLTRIGFSKLLRYPNMKSTVTDLIALPIIISLSSIRVLFAVGHSRPDFNPTLFATRPSTTPSIIVFSCSPRRWLTLIPRSLPNFRGEVAFCRTVFTSAHLQSRRLYKKLLIAYFAIAPHTDEFHIKQLYTNVRMYAH